jgi:hypothetical protein
MSEAAPATSDQEVEGMDADLSSLQELCVKVGRELSAAGGSLERLEQLPAQELWDEVASLRGKLDDLEKRTRELASGPGLDCTTLDIAQGAPRALFDAVGEILDQVRRWNESSGIRSAALAILKRVLRVQATDDPESGPVRELHALASTHERSIRVATFPGEVEGCAALAAGEHPLCHMLRLIENPELSSTEMRRHIAECTKLRIPLLIGPLALGTLVIEEPDGESDDTAEEPTPPDQATRDDGGETSASPGTAVGDASPAEHPAPDVVLGSLQEESPWPFMAEVLPVVETPANGEPADLSEPREEALTTQVADGDEATVEVGPGVEEDGHTVHLKPLEASREEGEPTNLVRMIEESADQTGLEKPIGVVASPTKKAASAAFELPNELRSFEQFRSFYWVGPSGQCEPAPWIAPGFAGDLERAVWVAVEERRLAPVWIYCTASELRELEPVFHPADLESLAEVLSAPQVEARGATPERGGRLRRAIEDGKMNDAPRWRLPLFLEAIRFTGGHGVIGEDWETVLELAGYRPGPLRKVLGELLVLSSRGVDRILERLGNVLQDPAQSSPNHLLQELSGRRREFQRLITTNWLAGGRIAHDHCRIAWSEFMAEAKEFFESLYPIEQRGSKQLVSKEIFIQVDRLRRRYTKIADRGGVGMHDRKRMNRLASQIFDEAWTIGEVLRSMDQAESRHHETEMLPVEPLRQLHGSDPLENPDEELLRKVLEWLVWREMQPPVDPGLDITAGDVCRRLVLLEWIPSGRASAVSTASLDNDQVCPADEITDPVAAAAVLMSPAVDQDETSEEPAGKRLAAMMQRDDHPGRLVKLSGLLWSSRRMMAQSKLADLRDRAQAIGQQLNEVWRGLQDLASPGAEILNPIIDQASQRIDDPATNDLHLLVEWLVKVQEQARSWLDRAVEELRERARTEEEEATASLILRALEDRQFGETMRLLGERTYEEKDGRRLRETPWRYQAERLYEKPHLIISDHAQMTGSELSKLWVDGIAGTGENRKLRNEFIRFVCDVRPGTSRAKVARTNLFSKAQLEQTEARIPTADIANSIAERGLNPCYLPQLTQRNDLVVLTPPVRVNASDFVRRTADWVAQRGAEAFAVVLAPRLLHAGREAVLREFRNRRLTAAVLDDIDYCRLIAPDGESPDLVIGLFEIFLEQQRWDALSPYTAQHGLNVAREMFVGRKDEAQRLSTGRDISRLFSGRKLGKSALLRYIHDTCDNQKLPGGGTLRVILIPSVGPDAREVVFLIKQQMEERLGYKPEEAGAQDDAAADLVSFMERFIRERPDVSLLVILDEADALVEAELERYPTRFTQCLSFRMRNEIETGKDSTGMPRVRFLFSGYRVTNTFDGPWANWGEVEYLRPLSPPDADELLAGPLARMGIDLGEQTRVASWRCGYQPAVLLKFGREMLRHLDETHPVGKRDHIVVTPEDVAHVFHSVAVRDETRTVVRNNFQGNRLGALVFDTLLMEFRDLPPGEGIRDAAERILRRLEQIDPDISWIQREHGRPQDEVNRLLADFVERELITRRRGKEDGSWTYFLRFPHHLPILCPSDQDAERQLREGITAFRLGEGKPGSSVKSLLGPNEMEMLRLVVKTTEASEIA